MARGPFKSILVAVEFPEERRQAGLARAAELAKRTGGRLTLVHCAFNPYAWSSGFRTVDIQQQIGALLAGQRAALERLAGPLRRRGLKVETQVVWDYPPYEAIVREVLRRKPDLVVAETRRHARGARLFLTNNDWQLTRLCPAPLLLVKKPGRYGKARVLAAIDPLHARAAHGRFDRRILLAARALATAYAGRLDVVHSYQPITSVIAAGMAEPLVVPIDPRIDRLHVQNVRRSVARATASLRLSPRRLHLDAGVPEVVIADRARRLRADVVVMGAVSRRGLDRVFIGNTAERVLDRLPCDVLVVKPDRFRTPVARRVTHSRVLLTPF